MSNPDRTDAAPDSFGDLPLQPTGSGVADLEIAYEQMKLDEENDDTSAWRRRRRGARSGPGRRSRERRTPELTRGLLTD